MQLRERKYRECCSATKDVTSPWIKFTKSWIKWFQGICLVSCHCCCQCSLNISSSLTLSTKMPWTRLLVRPIAKYSKWATPWCSTCVGPSLTQKYWTGKKTLGRCRHLRLFIRSVSYEEKSFKTLTPSQFVVTSEWQLRWRLISI